MHYVSYSKSIVEFKDCNRDIFQPSILFFFYIVYFLYKNFFFSPTYFFPPLGDE